MQYAPTLFFKAMMIEQLQDNLKSSVNHFVSLGNVLNLSYPKLWPSEQGTLMYALLMAGRRLSKFIAQAHRLQEKFIPDVTGLNLIDTRGELLNLMSYLEQGDCDLDIAYNYSDKSEPIFEPNEIVAEENINNLFPAKEQAQHYVNARKLMIETSKINYAELDECIKGVNEKIDKILADGKNLKRDKDFRMERFKAMEDFYTNNFEKQDRAQLLARVKGELDDKENEGMSEAEILNALYQDIVSENTVGNSNQTLCFINMVRKDREEVARLFAEYRACLSVDDVVSHFRFRENDKLISDHMESRSLLEQCDEYQGKLFENKAALEFAKLIKSAIACYVGFENKMNAAFLFYAMRDLGLIYTEENNATLMADFVKEVYEAEISADTITRPLRKSNGQPFCMIDENNLRSFTEREFKKYKEPYWLCYSIINKVLDKKGVECASYLDQLHPTIASKDVFENLNEEEKSRLYFLSSVLRGDTLMF